MWLDICRLKVVFKILTSSLSRFLYEMGTPYPNELLKKTDNPFINLYL